MMLAAQPNIHSSLGDERRGPARAGLHGRARPAAILTEVEVNLAIAREIGDRQGFKSFIHHRLTAIINYSAPQAKTATAWGRVFVNEC